MQAFLLTDKEIIRKLIFEFHDARLTLEVANALAILKIVYSY